MRKLNLVGISTCIVILVIAGMAGAAAGQTYYGCYNKKTGAFVVEVNGKGHCAKNQIEVAMGSSVPGPPGPAGPAGPAGPSPAAWLTSVFVPAPYVSQLTTYINEGINSYTAACNKGSENTLYDLAISGGAMCASPTEWVNATGPVYTVVIPSVASQPTGWTATCVNSSGGAYPPATVWVECIATSTNGG